MGLLGCRCSAAARKYFLLYTDKPRRRRPRHGRPAGRRDHGGAVRPAKPTGGPPAGDRSRSRRAPSPSSTPSVPPASSAPRLSRFFRSRSWGWGMTEEESGVRRWLVDISSWRPSPAQFDAAAALLPPHERPAIARYRTSSFSCP